MISLSPKEQLFFLTVRIVAASRYEESVGTGFFVGISQADPPRYFLVTAKHVVESWSSGDIYFIPSSGTAPTLAPPVPYRWERHIWTFHPDPGIDVAVAPFELLKLDAVPGDITMFVIPDSDFLPKWERAEPSIFELLRQPQPVTEVLVIGYPGNYFDRTNGLPILRRGITASPLSVDYEGDPVFLVDAALLKGSSGSPVVFINDRKSPADMKLLGMVTSVLPSKHFNGGGADGAPVTNLAGVLKAHTILETIHAASGNAA